MEWCCISDRPLHFTRWSNCLWHLKLAKLTLASSQQQESLRCVPAKSLQFFFYGFVTAVATKWWLKVNQIYTSIRHLQIRPRYHIILFPGWHTTHQTKRNVKWRNMIRSYDLEKRRCSSISLILHFLLAEDVRWKAAKTIYWRTVVVNYFDHTFGSYSKW